MYGQETGLSRSWEAAIATTPKYQSDRGGAGDGLHGYRKAQLGVHEKRTRGRHKLARCYSLRDAQLRRYAERARAAKGRSPRALAQILESRLDNVVRRLRWARSIWQARQMVAQGHFLVNGRKIDLPSFRVKTGDTIAVNEDSRPFVRQSAAASRRNGFNVPDWLSVDRKQLRGRVLHLPDFKEVPVPLEADYKEIIKSYGRWLPA